MFTRDERRAFLFLMAVATAGAGARFVRPRGAAPGAGLVAPHLVAGDLVRQAAAAKRAEELARPLAPGETVDVDRAGAPEIERLPRIGPDLARRIVADREANGPFGSLDGLARVPGVGAGTLRLLEPAARFSGVARAPGQGPGPRAAARRLDDGPRPGATSGPRGAADGPCTALQRPLPLNRASAAELACLPGVGPALAARIVEDRRARGPFAEVQALERVPGIGPARLARLATHVSAP